MNWPNRLTMLRVFMIPVFIVLLMLAPVYEWTRYAAAGVFILACLTDLLDGKIARKYNMITDFGKFMDPLADKLLVTSAILIFVEWGQIPSWAAFLIIAREFAVTALRLVAVDSGIVIAAGMSGKVKTAVTMVCLCVMMTSLHTFELFPGFTVDSLCVALMVITTLWSGFQYFRNHAGLLKLK
jgi:CDP-diacylglycerol--glycerol-3-phosphate 3-phosphatidyltransferase